MALLFFNKLKYGSMIGHHVGGMLLPSNMVAKTTFCLYLVRCLIVTHRCALNVTTSSFQNYFP